MAEPIETILKQATEAGNALLAEGTLARAACYDRSTGHLSITLSNGASVTIPVHLIESLRDAPEAARETVEVAGIGHGLHWPDIDLDLSVPALLAGVFGTRRWVDMQRAGHAGRSTSVAKSSASRQNGAKGGRPRKPTPQIPT
jgi:hypothetical protein